MLKTSIVILTRNNENHISTLLSSISHQDYKDFEVINIDLCSTDNTLSFLKKYPVKVFRLEQKNSDMAHTINMATKNCAGNFIFILSGKSIPRKNNFISSGLKCLFKSNHALTFGPKFTFNEAPIAKLFNINRWFSIRNRIQNIDTDDIIDIYPDVFAFRKDAWQDNYFPQNIDNFIWDWSFKIMNNGYKIIYNPDMATNSVRKTGLINFLRERSSREKQFRDYIKRRKSELLN